MIPGEHLLVTKCLVRFNTLSLFLCRPLPLLKTDLFRTEFKIFLQDFALKKPSYSKEQGVL